MRALFSSISASTADDDAVAPQVRSRFDGDTLVQVSYASSVLKALFPRSEISVKVGVSEPESDRSTLVDDLDPLYGLTFNLFLKIWTS